MSTFYTHKDASAKWLMIMIQNLGTWQDRVDVAIKQLRDDRMDNAGGYEKAKDEFFKEARIFKLMNHPNLVQVRILFISGSIKL